MRGARGGCQNRDMSRRPAHPTVAPELHDWIVAQSKAGRSNQDLLRAMQASGWDVAAAHAALQQALPQMRLPDWTAVDVGSALQAPDRQVRLLLTLQQPRLALFGAFLADDECDALIELARPRLARSRTVAANRGHSEVNAARTSDGMFYERGEAPLVARIEQRIAALLDWPVQRGEGLQVLRYTAGAQYRPHFDYFDPAQPGNAAVLARGGQRLATLIMYLQAPQHGGATVFPDAGLQIAPVKGHALFFGYDAPHASSGTLHGGEPVVEGEKWVATKWLREGDFD